MFERFTFDFFILCIYATLILCHDVAPQQPHYRDGVHNNNNDGDEKILLSHTCQELQDMHHAHGNHALAPYSRSPMDSTIQNDLDRLQKPSDNCRDSATRRFLFYAMHADCGFGAEMHWLTVALHAALVTNRTLVLLENESWIYAESPFCKVTLFCW
jgi:hypothetical protein